MLNYIKEFQNLINNVKNQINIENDGYKLIDLKMKLEKLTDSYNYFIKVIYNNFDQQQILEFATEVLDGKIINKAQEEAAKFNSELLSKLIESSYEKIELKKQEINKIYKDNPNIEDEQDYTSNEYRNLRKLRSDIKMLEDNILIEKNKIISFHDKLNEENKDNLLTNLIRNMNKGKESYNDIFNKIKEYKSNYDFNKNVIYPVQKKFEELVNKDNDLSNYLLENEENIKRLTAISDNTITWNINHFAVLMQYHSNSKRHELFSIAAKKHNISDIVDKQGQFNNKIYTDKDAHNRYISSIKELKINQELKEKFKFLLKEMDKLNLVDNNSSANESNYKEYGFINFITAKNQFINNINSNASSDDIVKSLELLKLEEQKINTMFKLIEETLGDDYNTLPGNVNSYRNSNVPSEFKENLVIHSKFNSLHIMLTFIKENGLSIDEFVDKPIENVTSCYDKEFEKRNLNKILKGKTKSEAIKYISNSKELVSYDDPFKYTRSIQSLYLDEENIEYKKDNLLSITSLDTKIGCTSRTSNIKDIYFDGDAKETLQNIFLAKENENGEIPYYDCYVSSNTYQEDLMTGFIIDGKDTILEKISKDNNIVETFYNALEILKDYTIAENNKKDDYIRLSSNDVLSSVQDFACKILLTIDFSENKYPESFFNDLCNVITNYKKVDTLKDFEYRESNRHKANIAGLLNEKDTIVDQKEKDLINIQKSYDEKFIKEFERINKEIDELDKKADKIGKKIGKGKTNEEIDMIVIEQSKKFNELRNLQNERFEQLRTDYEKGNISQLYFEKRSQQIQLLENIKDVPVMFICDDKNYKNFKTYKKNVLKDDYKILSDEELRNNYELLMANSKEEKRLFYLTNALSERSLGKTKFVNSKKLENIEIVDKTDELQSLSNLRVELEKQSIVVDLNEELLAPQNNEVRDDLIIKSDKIL